MKKKKKIMIGSIVAAAILLLCVGGVLLAKKMNAVTVSVIPASDLMQNFNMGTSSLNGTVTNNVTQKVQLEKDAIIEQVYVSKGKKVNIGDKLVTYDMTLKEMELEIQRLTQQQSEQQLSKARERLAELQAGGKVTKDDMNAGGVAPQMDTPTSPETENLACLDSSFPMGTQLLATAMRIPQYMSAKLTAGAEEIDAIEDSVIEDLNPADPSSGDDKKDEDVVSDTTPDGEGFYRALGFKSQPYAGTGTKEDPFRFLCSSADGGVVVTGGFLNKMAGYADEDGTQKGEEGPYYFRLEFHKDNQLADPEKPEDSLVGYYYKNGGTLKEPAKSDDQSIYSLEGAKQPDIGGSADLTPTPVQTPTPVPTLIPTPTVLPNDEPGGGGSNNNNVPGEEGDVPGAGGNLPGEEGDVPGAGGNVPEEEGDVPGAGGNMPGEEGDVPGAGGNVLGEEGDVPGEEGDVPGSGSEVTMTREQAIAAQQSAIKSLQLSVRNIALKISRLEKTLNNKTVLASIKGVVKTVGDPVTGASDGNAFIEVESEDGLYVKGELSESRLDTIETGQMLTGMVYETGAAFDATIREISTFPGDSENYDGMGNPNVSYYPFIAQVSDQKNLKDQDMVQLNLAEDKTSSQNLSIIAAFVRNEDGQYYVLKEEKGKLKKQIVKVGSSDGYTTEIKSGLTLEDKLAFPYGKGVEEGAKAKEGTLEDLYGVM